MTYILGEPISGIGRVCVLSSVFQMASQKKLPTTF